MRFVSFRIVFTNKNVDLGVSKSANTKHDTIQFNPSANNTADYNIDMNEQNSQHIPDMEKSFDKMSAGVSTHF